MKILSEILKGSNDKMDKMGMQIGDVYRREAVDPAILNGTIVIMLQTGHALLQAFTVTESSEGAALELNRTNGTLYEKGACIPRGWHRLGNVGPRLLVQ